MAKLEFIRLDQIRQNKVALRDVTRTDEDFIDLVQSIKQQGVLSAISVREKTDANDDKKYELVDGLQRFTASAEAGTGVVDMIDDPANPGKKIPSGKYIEVEVPDADPTKPNVKKLIGVIPAQIIDRDEAETMIAQIIGNAHKIETQPTQYAKAMVRYLGYNPTMTENELAIKVGKSPQWLQKTLKLNNLHANIKPLVDAGDVPLINAYSLAKLPPEEQLNWLERAQTEKSEQFVASVTKRAKEIRDSNKKGQDASPEQFQPVRHLRKKPELESEAERPQILPALIRDLELTKDIKANPQGLIEAAVRGAQLALNWGMNFDPKSQQAQREKDAARKKQESEQKIRRDAERTQKKEEEANKKAAEAREAAAKARQAAAALPPEPEKAPSPDSAPAAEATPEPATAGAES